MALAVNHRVDERVLSTSTNSIASTPLGAVVIAPIRGQLVLCRAVSHGAFTTDCSVAITTIPAVAGGTAPTATAITGSPMTITASNSAAGTSASLVPGAVTIVNEGDMIKFLPSGSTGTTIGATFYAHIVPA